ncbi:MAG: cyclase family protein [Deltaproteobacteria bacterium]|nr:cyclase family protein [Deltaproteobacteria bacterium]MBW1934354.1 cyclase family protein [Deltaproteobacteria bacterium]MBW1978468.1 cyclase family protein [Deltaproteobacteria bacterium]MBW2043462.1 cyclase family protein [Deltaproteobacteria bacterium]MBW2299418.1 cyclase family protein [Deltaproteobacteria bacterium]
MKTTIMYSVLIGAVCLALSGCGMSMVKGPTVMGKPISSIPKDKFVDLTHAFSPSIPIPEGLPKPKRKSIYGGAVQIFTHAGQYGTHLDAAGHFHKGMRLVDAIPPYEFVLPGCVIDISRQAINNFDYQLKLSDVKKWEEKYGPIPEGSMVMLRTDWSYRWTDPNAFFAKDKKGQKHYPGWGKEALQYLVEKRKIRAIGHETPDTDSGITCGVDKGWPLESYVLGKNLWQIEMLNNLDQLPPRDFLVFVGVPKAEKATGFPVRVIAILP